MAQQEISILVVEDEPKVGAFIQEGLQEQGFQVDLVSRGSEALQAFSDKPYQMAILDVLLPEVSGIELCKSFRSQNPKIPILLLTALGTTTDKLKGFDSGADDYLVKPFEFQELLARIKALTRRSFPAPEVHDVLVVADLELDLIRKKIKRGNQEINLTATEFRLLEYLMKNRDRVISKEEIGDKVWGMDFDTGTNYIEVYINLLRKKIDKEFPQKLIHTRFGLGYYFSDHP
jgi:DNA-binding response OmpR family regulator